MARVLDNKCVSCHNPNKRKGELLLTNMENLSSGGETGPAFVTGNPEQSELIRRLRLPVEDEEHMPPEGKSPLTDNEINILERWIALGASDTLRLSHLNNNEPLMAMVKGMMAPSDRSTRAPLPKMADSTLQRLSSDYVTIRRVAGNSEALSLSLFLPPEYDPKLILNLREIVLNIVELDLSGLPLGEKEMELVTLCKNLERLEIDRSGITDHELLKLKGFDRLKYLKAYSTNLTDESLAAIKSFKNLEELYIWDTQITSAGLSQIRTALPNLVINTGIDKEVRTSFVENDSI